MQTNANVVWNNGVKGNGVLKTEFLDAKVAIPTVLGGSGDGAFPKEVLVASVTACYTSVLVSMAESRGLPVVEISVDSEASISDDKIIHHPQLVLSENATDKQVQSAERLFVAADKGCVVGNLLKKADVKIEVQGEIFTT
ncbi:OsmC family protein [Peribacillus simplex]|uniref:OsmC family protein n=2 Tax=Peribacillus TaxID=2675229 RepID=A0AA90T3B2_9BACI|nr:MULTISPECIES: OsmC family protein [Peribacillus]MDP1421436.1 OsmC family protein [Peribacillus simplex]MDP1454184.1 OsmC family protein [Peribacillus frigoritolerans]